MTRVLFAFLLLWFAPAYALTVDTPLPDATQEARAKALFVELRCMVCSGESIADSPADVARDMRAYTRTLIAEGKSDDEVMDAFTLQYGEKVLMMPRLNSNNALLWAAPLLALLLGGWLIARRVFTGVSDDGAV